MSKHFSLRSNIIHLSSRQINDIFTGLLHRSSITNIKDNFIFEVTENKLLKEIYDLNAEDLFKLEILIPRHAKFPQNDNRFENFNDLFSFFDSHKMRKGQLPYLGDDTV